MMLDRLDTLIAFAVVMLGVSLLLTIAVQFLSAALGMRGSDLLWGIEKILELNGIRDKHLARQVLTHPSISDSIFSSLAKQLPGVDWLVQRWRLATAIRPDELARILKQLAKQTQVAEPAKPIGEAIEEALSAVDEVAHDKLQGLQKELSGAASDWTVAADRVVRQMTESARQSVMKLDASFAMVMDRVAQRFTMKMRCITVILAFVVAFGAHLDSLKLLEQLGTHPEQRGALVSMHEAVLQQAQSFNLAARPQAPGAETVVAPAILKEAMDNLRKTAGDAALPPTPKFASYTEAANWLGANGQTALEPRYRQAVLSALAQHASDINERIVRSGFRLISPRPYRVLPLFDGRRNLLGMLITAAFLSLGAPFWFNALKGLSNLRTVLAANEKKETGKA